jgi:Hemerythrin HHE cation binding domain
MTEIDFTGFLLAHRCLRREYGRLAEAACHPLDVRHKALIEEQIAVTLSMLHHHHAEEESWLLPTLRQRAPHAIADLDRLETLHTQIDPLIAAAADTSRPLPQRAAVLAELQETINAHLDEEEGLVLPLSSAHITVEEWDAFGQRVHASIPRTYMPIVLGWVFNEATSEEWASVRQMLPQLVRFLLALSWGPSYAKRRRRLYPQPPVNAGS